MARDAGEDLDVEGLRDLDALVFVGITMNVSETEEGAASGGNRKFFRLGGSLWKGFYVKRWLCWIAVSFPLAGGEGWGILFLRLGLTAG